MRGHSLIFPNIRPRDPVMLGLCTQVNLNETVARAAKKNRGSKAKSAPAPEVPATLEIAPAEPNGTSAE